MAGLGIGLRTADPLRFVLIPDQDKHFGPRITRRSHSQIKTLGSGMFIQVGGVDEDEKVGCMFPIKSMHEACGQMTTSGKPHDSDGFCLEAELLSVLAQEIPSLTGILEGLFHDGKRGSDGVFKNRHVIPLLVEKIGNKFTLMSDGQGMVTTARKEKDGPACVCQGCFSENQDRLTHLDDSGHQPPAGNDRVG